MNSGQKAGKVRRPVPQAGDGLLVIDVQNDFLPKGKLAVPGGDEIIPPLNHAIALFATNGLKIIATRDWHPAKHCSFREQGGSWPPHCIAGTYGARFAEALQLPASALIVSKATRVDRDAYSGFRGTSLARELRSEGIRRLVVGGLATDYCVFNTVKDALAEGFETIVLTDAVRPVDVKPGDGQRALDEMIRLGARPLTSSDLGVEP